MRYKIHKNTKLTPALRMDIWNKYKTGVKVSQLACMYNVSRPTIYKVMHRARVKDFFVHKSTNHKYRNRQYGLLRLVKIKQAIIEKKNKDAIRYNKSYPGEMIHIDTKLLPSIKGTNLNLFLNPIILH